MLVLETGSGVRGANSYVLASYVTSYLTNRGREADWVAATDAARDASCIAATDYIDARWGNSFLGVRKVRYQGQPAKGIIDFSGQPTPGESITIGERVYQFVSALSALGVDEVLIGATLEETIGALSEAILRITSGEGQAFSEGQPQNTSVTSNAESARLTLTAIEEGQAGNDIPLISAVAQATASGFLGGLDEAVQTREFPRAGLAYRGGGLVTGIPEQLRQATAEYAVRALSSSLFRDPTTDDTGRVVREREERVGPIIDKTVYADGDALASLIKPYPAADRLLDEFIRTGGGSFR